MTKHKLPWDGIKTGRLIHEETHVRAVREFESKLAEAKRRWGVAEEAYEHEKHRRMAAERDRDLFKARLDCECRAHTALRKEYGGLLTAKTHPPVDEIEAFDKAYLALRARITGYST